MNAFRIFFFVLLLISNFAHAAEAESNVDESNWVPLSEMNTLFARGNDNRLMMFKVVGKMADNFSISYKASFRPFPPNLDRFFAYYGMGDQWYRARKTALEDAGFTEIWHQSFRDSTQQEVHQAVWQKLLPTSHKQDRTKPINPRQI